MASGNGNADNQYITIEELLLRIGNACDGMGAQNPHRVLLEQCRVAIVYLVQRVPDESLRTRSPIITP